MKLAEALVLRKHLIQKLEQLKPIKNFGEDGLLEQKVQRVNVNETTDEVKIQVPKVTLAEVTKQYDTYSKALRLLDTAIQQTNWTADLVDYKQPEGIEI